MGAGPVIIYLVLQHLLCQPLPESNLRRCRSPRRPGLRVVGIHLRQANHESELAMLPKLSTPSLVQANGIVPAIVVVVDPMLRLVVTGDRLGIWEGLPFATQYL